MSLTKTSLEYQLEFEDNYQEDYDGYDEYQYNQYRIQLEAAHKTLNEKGYEYIKSLLNPLETN